MNQPTHRLTYTDDAGKTVVQDVFVCDRGKGGVYLSAKDAQEGNPCAYLEYSDEGGWVLYGRPVNYAVFEAEVV